MPLGMRWITPRAGSVATRSIWAAELAQALVDALVAAIDLADVPISLRPSAHSAAMSIAMPARMSGDDRRSPRRRLGPVTIARCGSQSTMSAPIEHELVGEDHAVLEHPLVDEDRAAALGGQRDGDRGQVGRERGPRAVLDLGLVLADVALGDELLVAGHDHVGAVELGAQAQAREDEADHAQVLGLGVLDRELAAGHAGQRDERADLDVVGADVVRAAAELVLAADDRARWSRCRGCRRPS